MVATVPEFMSSSADANSTQGTRGPRTQVAVLVPCYNEELTVGKVVRDFRQALPDAAIYVFDNNSTDGTAELAKKAGAIVVSSRRQGKGNVVRHMFDVVDADWYVMVDGDDTYLADAAPRLIEEAERQGVDMMVGARLESNKEKSFRRFHRFGNHLITGLIRLLFRTHVTDVLSGYRVFSREFVKSIPLRSEGFAIETELTLQAVAKQFVLREIPIPYGERPEGSHSKLSTWSDGWIILQAIVFILKDFKPLVFFFSLGLLLVLASLAAGWAPITDFIETGMVPHFPRAILAAALGILAGLSFSVGLILETVHRYHVENFILWRKTLKR